MDVHQNPGPDAIDLSIFHLNIRSVRHKISYLDDLAPDYDILCITESHLDENVTDSDLVIDGFDIVRRDRTNHGGGILIYVSKNLFFKRLHQLESQNTSSEFVWIEIKSRSETYLLCTAYRAPNIGDLFWTSFENSLDAAFDMNPNIIILGDLNVDLLVETNHKLNHIINHYQLTNVIKSPTRISDARQSLLDPILVTECSNSFAEVIPTDRNISDHEATVIDIPLSNINPKSFKRKIWNYENGDFVTLNNKINEFDWESLFASCENTDEACTKFTEIYLAFVNETIPSKIVTVKTTDKPWFNSRIKREIRIRDRLRRKAKKSGNESHLRQYKDKRNHVNNLKKSAKESFYQNVDGFVDHLSTQNSKGFWKLINTLTKSIGKLESIPPLLNPENLELETDEQAKAELLNRYFASISNIDDLNADVPEIDMKTSNHLSNISISESDIIDILKTLKLGKANGIDEISHHMLKFTINSVVNPLKLLFNMSLSSHKFPSLWKKALVMPLYKKDDKHLPSNYRPISLLSTVGKVFERCLFKYLHNYMLDNKLFYEFQSGFLPNHSTTYQLIELYHHICLNRERNEHTCLVFCDISKAFDKVWHRGLIKKLSSFGFSGHLLDFLQDYLSDREQAVILKNHRSSFLKLGAGVPQGTVLGPFLFLIFINDIAENLISLARLFADDTSLLHSSKQINDIERTINSDLEKVLDWSKKWFVTFNPAKTDILVVSNRSVPNLNIIFGDSHPNITETHKHLGITFSSDGKWTAHINNISNSALKQINVLKKLKFTLSRKSLGKIYTTFILPILEYACELWDGCNDYESIKLEQIQYHAARIVTGLPLYASKESLLRETGWETLQVRREKRKLSLFYKIQNGQTPEYLTNLLPDRVHQSTPYNLRNSDEFRQPQYRLQSTIKSFFPSATSLWNDLDYEIKVQPSLKVFRKSLSSSYPSQQVPEYFLVGARKDNILLTRLRNASSSLNDDLYRVNLANSPICSCRYPIENVYHFFLDCPLYHTQRTTLMNRLRPFLNQPISLDQLLYGKDDLTVTDNIYIQLALQDFVSSSGRVKEGGDWEDLGRPYPQKLPVPLDRLAMTTWRRQIFFVGGVYCKKDRKDEKRKFLTEARMFSYTTSVSAMSSSRDEADDGEDEYIQQEFLSPWRLDLPNMNFGRHSHGAIALAGDKIYVFGGSQLESGLQVREVEFFDLCKGVWEEDFRFRKGDVSNVTCAILEVPYKHDEHKLNAKLKWVMW
ncbi:hypothetical protein FSP39_008683 [Pinctada imbricata]|uniref:Reverse transcriptase domain-containing protein n=1 Tax=Pinctada imbricata TaxID=66713 RepID=A0AA88XNM7_PINIB|nr:hypothetical protein FSP39_008683 [Pinctada imbricata]